MKKIIILITLLVLFSLTAFYLSNYFYSSSDLSNKDAQGIGVLPLPIVETPYTPEVITASGRAVVPVNFFNDYESSLFSAVLEKNSSIVRVEPSSIYVEKGEFGNFNLITAEENPDKGVYFNSLLISDGIRIIKIPIIIGIESSRASLDYDVSIDFTPSSDISIISSSQEVVVSPNLEVYKLDYNTRAPNGIVLKFFIYSIEGNLLYSSEEVVSVSRQSTFEHISNLGADYPSEVLMVALVEREESVGIDLSQISLPSNDILLSPPVELIDYSSKIYRGIFLFLVSFVILLSYFWHNKTIEQAKDWKSRVDEIRKTKFSDVARSLRKLKDQKEVLERAYSNHYITKNSFDSALIEISRLAAQLKKRL